MVLPVSLTTIGQAALRALCLLACLYVLAVGGTRALAARQAASKASCATHAMRVRSHRMVVRCVTEVVEGVARIA